MLGVRHSGQLEMNAEELRKLETNKHAYPGIKMGLEHKRSNIQTTAKPLIE